MNQIWKLLIICSAVNSFFSQADPCSSYTVLNEKWRSTKYKVTSETHCDSNLNGWYRFTGDGGVQMPENCVPKHSCGTDAPLWLSGSHPLVTDGIVTRTACGHWDTNCCHFSNTVEVKACPEGFFVYKFTGTTHCSLVYCADADFICNTCAGNEECMQVDGEWGCHCKATLTNHSDLGYLQPELSCGSQQMKVSLEKCKLETMGFSFSTIHLRNSSCTGMRDPLNRSVISLTSLLSEGHCGTTVLRNSTHVTFKNRIHLSKSGTPEKPMYIRFHCTYPLEIQVNLLSSLHPAASYSIGGSGTYQVKMALFQSPSYTIPFEGSEIALSPEDHLYMELNAEGIDSRMFTLVMKNFYATPSWNTIDPIKYYIVQNSCLNNQDPTSTIELIDGSNKVRVSFLLSKFLKQYDEVYLHSEVHLCDTANKSCKSLCSGNRNRRDATSYSRVLTIGPVKLSGAESISDEAFPVRVLSSGALGT
nr:PREDICTED: uromodulin-like isoform X3 [Latimeria chalumnae]|eukprot:XP_014352175.1 PREDICTED: uromodulin-like isoform X3 [Latimeria chalumnae]